MENKFCTQCGNVLVAKSKFCSQCDSIQKLVVEKDLTQDNLKGVKGWLILPILGLFFTLYQLGQSVYSSSLLFVDGLTQNVLHIDGIVVATGFQIVTQSAIFFYILYLFILIEKDSKHFPNFYIYFSIAFVLSNFMEIQMLTSVVYPNEETQKLFIGTDLYKPLIHSMVQMFIWGIYMKVSERVKHTFIK